MRRSIHVLFFYFFYFYRLQPAILSALEVPALGVLLRVFGARSRFAAEAWCIFFGGGMFVKAV